MTTRGPCASQSKSIVVARGREIGEVVVLVVVTMPHLEAVNYFFNKTELNLVHNLLTILVMERT